MSDLVAWPTMAVRSLRLSTRNMDAVLTSLMLPVMLMLMFVYLFGGSISTGTTYVNYAVPGVIILCAAFGASLTAIAVAFDLQEGIVDRFRSMDIGGRALLGGHVTASTLRNLAATAVVFVVAFLIGFRPEAGLRQWLAAVALLTLFMIAMGALSAAAGLVARSVEGANGFTFFVLFLPYPSSAFVQIETMPGWLQPIARNQPVTSVIDSVRGLLLDRPVGSSPATAVAWCLGLTLAAVVASGFLFRRRTS